jgi:hypothetical protein
MVASDGSWVDRIVRSPLRHHHRRVSIAAVHECPNLAD